MITRSGVGLRHADHRASATADASALGTTPSKSSRGRLVAAAKRRMQGSVIYDALKRLASEYTDAQFLRTQNNPAKFIALTTILSVIGVMLINTGCAPKRAF
eukprot:82500-Pyramimonas_sp.AAC.1